MEINLDTKFTDFKSKKVQITTSDGNPLYIGCLFSFDKKSFTLRNCRIYTDGGLFKKASHKKLSIAKMKNNYISLYQNGCSLSGECEPNRIEAEPTVPDPGEVVSEVPEAHGTENLYSQDQDSHVANPLSPPDYNYSEQQYFQPVFVVIPSPITIDGFYFGTPWFPQNPNVNPFQDMAWIPVQLVCIVLVPTEGPNSLLM